MDSIGVDPKTNEKSLLRTTICCWADLCQAKACCLWNCVFSPFITCYHAFRIYVCGCFGVHFRRGFLRFFCCCCRALDCTIQCCGCIFACCAWYHIDHKFPPRESSLGAVGGDSADKSAGKTDTSDIMWLRASTFSTVSAAEKEQRAESSTVGKIASGATSSKMSDSKMVLYADGLSASDIMQGQLGDCWLMAAFACLAEVPGGIDNLFLTKEFDPRGKYTIQLFDGTAKGCVGCWRKFTIDDFVPCSRSQYVRNGKVVPKFCQPNGNELWVMLLEKAFAKMCGSYAQLEGGSTIWALRAMTGDHCRWYEKDTKGGVNWDRLDFVNTTDNSCNLCPTCHKPIARDKRDGKLMKTNERLNSDEAFDTLLRYRNRRSVLCASGANGDDGLVSGHAYSIIDVVRTKTHSRTSNSLIRLLLIRNPWGSGTWKGDWSNNSKSWESYPDLQKTLLPKAVDGAFWMHWDDFQNYWGRYGIADRTLDINSLHFQHDQEDRWCGPTKGMFSGCFNFWCHLSGCRRLYCPKRSSDKNVALDGDGKPICCGCSKSSVTDRL